MLWPPLSSAFQTHPNGPVCPITLSEMLANGTSPLPAHARPIRPGVRPSIARKIADGVENPSALLGSEFACDMASARSAGASRSNRMPHPFDSSLLSSMRLRFQTPFWSLQRGSQQNTTSPALLPARTAGRRDAHILGQGQERAVRSAGE